MNKKIGVMIIVLVALCIVLPIFASASSFVYNNLEIPQIEREDYQMIVYYNLSNVNHSNSTDYWDALDTPADIYYDDLSASDIDISGYEIIASFLMGIVGSLDLRGDPWYFSGAGLELAEYLLVGGDTELLGDLTVEGNTSMTNNLAIGGNITIQGNIIPNTTLSSNIGSGANRWNWLYVRNISAEYINTYNITSEWFLGNFNWTIAPNSTNYLYFDGNQLALDETNLNDTIDARNTNGTNYWNRTATVLYPANLSQTIGIGTNNPDTNFDLEIRNTIERNGNNNTYLVLSSGTGNDNTTLLFRESSAHRYKIYYDGLNAIFGIYSYAMDKDLMWFNIPGNIFMRNNLTVGDWVNGRFNWTVAPNSTDFCYFDGNQLSVSGSYLNSTISTIANGSFVPYIGATQDIQLGYHNISLNGTITWPEGTGIKRLWGMNHTGGDNFYAEYWYDFEMINDDWMIFRKADGNDAAPDGGIGFMMTNSSSANRTILKLDGYGLANFTDYNITTTSNVKAKEMNATNNVFVGNRTCWIADCSVYTYFNGTCIVNVGLTENQTVC